jgi:hypothetical protein
MTRERGVPLDRSTDDLGFPAESDPGGFGLAFVAVTCQRTIPARRTLRRRKWEATDDLGLPPESDPGDFASAFLSVRDHRLLA